MKSSVSSKISRYSFDTLLIDDEIDHETVVLSVVTSSESYESSRTDYGFMVVSTESFSSESSELLAIIQKVISSTSFTSCLELIPESNL